MTLSNGYRLGSYEIVAPLGAGGMGEVYLARDARLAREVAVKVLPEAFLADRERLARFDREAHLLASLNHANVAAIYGFEEANGLRFLVLELVPGETLAERFARGPLELDEALPLFRQIAEALESAHEKGIVHRDLKPANIKVTPAGKVKVLDFGLGKVFEKEGAPSDVSRSPTITHGATHQGVILGTAAYMSPEQARGKPVDKRTDIWSFGCVLFEALTGHRGFDGDTATDVMASVLTREPDWNALPVSTPARVRYLLRRCLQKDPERRLHDIADARLEIEEAVVEPSIGEPAAPAGPRGARWIGLAGAAAAGALIASLLAWRLPRTDRAAAPAQVTRLARLTHPTARTEWPAWSPDGSLLAYASDRSGNFEIYVRRGETGQDVNVTNDPGQDIQPSISPDGNSIAFISTRSSRSGLIKIGGALARNARTYGGDLWVAPVLGGAARRLAPDANSPSWRPDGKGILYVSGPENRRTILEVSPNGGGPRVVWSGGKSNYEIVRLASSPDGRWVSFETQLEGIFLMPAAGGEPHSLLTGFSHAWDGSSRRIHFVSLDPQGGSRVQFAQIDSASGSVAGDPTTVSLMIGSLWDLAVSRDGLQIAVAEEAGSRNLTRLQLDAGGGAPAGPEEPLSTGRVTDAYPAISPDGRRVAYSSDVLGRTEIWILELESGQRSRLLLPGEDLLQVSPVWSPDGRRLMLSRLLPNRIYSIWAAAVDGSGAEEIIRGEREGVVGSVDVTRDGRTVFFSKAAHGYQQVFALDLQTRQLTQLTDSPDSKFDLVLSPDGRWLAVAANKDGVVQLFRMPASGGPMQQLTTGFERMRHPFYSPDGRWIYIQPSHRNIYRVPAEGGRLEQVTHFPDAGLFLEEPAISPDGRYLYYCRGNGGSSLWLMSLGGSPDPAGTPAP